MRRALVLMLIIYTSILSIRAEQEKQIKGYVKDTDNRPVKFCSVILKNKQIGTYTNSEGYFNLKVPNSKSDSIIISHIGYKRRALVISELIKKDTAVIYLDENAVKLDEIVVKPGSYLSTNYKNSKRERNVYIGSVGTILAYHVNEGVGGFLDEVEFYFRKQKTKSAYVLLRVIYPNQRKLEEKDNVLDTPLIYEIKPGMKKLRVNLSEFAIEIPEKGLLVGLEFMGNPNLSDDEYNVRNGEGRVGVILTTKKNKPKTFVSAWHNDWNLHKTDQLTFSYTQKHFNLKISYIILERTN
jgi:hypothetical protein